MPTLRASVTARLEATGVSEPVARRLAALIEQDLRKSGYVLVRTAQLDLLTHELSILASGLRTMADACMRLERPKGSSDEATV